MAPSESIVSSLEESSSSRLSLGCSSLQAVFSAISLFFGFFLLFLRKIPP
jgi:hypothetical protein